MILCTENFAPKFQGLVQHVFENKSKNGGVFKTYSITTREKNEDGSFKYSKWDKVFLTKNCGVTELNKGDIVTSTKFKITNVPYKKADGSWVNNNCEVLLMNCEVGNGGSQATGDEAEEDCPY